MRIPLRHLLHSCAYSAAGSPQICMISTPRLDDSWLIFWSAGTYTGTITLLRTMLPSSRISSCVSSAYFTQELLQFISIRQLAHVHSARDLLERSMGAIGELAITPENCRLRHIHPFLDVGSCALVIPIHKHPSGIEHQTHRVMTESLREPTVTIAPSDEIAIF